MTNALLLRRRGMMQAKQGGLPYDAEIEYIRGTGTQWIFIDSGITLPTIAKVEYKARHTSSNNNQRVLTHGGVSAKNNFSVWEANVGYFTSMLGVEQQITSSTQNSDHIIEQERLSSTSGKFTINGSTTTNVTGTFLPGASSIAVMASTSGTNIYKGILYYMKLWQNNALLYDLIPVRVGQVGYLYDRVSGRLFGNSGTGDFILGPDVQ